MVTIRSLSKYFRIKKKRFTALDGISLSFSAGDRVFLFGANASGKTTLLKCLCGILLPDRGTIETGCSHPAAVRFVSSAVDSFYPQLTLYQNLEFFSYPYRNDTAALKKNLQELTAVFNLDEYGEVPFQNCSQGFKKRAGIAAALINRPEILLIDEWDSPLDELTVGTLVDFLRSVAYPDIVICSSFKKTKHVDFFNKAVILEKGRLVFSGTMSVMPKEADK